MEVIKTENAPAAIGPYSQAIKSGGFVFCSGQIALKPGDGTLISEDLREQTKQVMENLKAVLEASGSSLDKVVKTTIYLTSIAGFADVNEIYGSYFVDNKPARATVEVSNLPKGAKIEIDCIAIV